MSMSSSSNCGSTSCWGGAGSGAAAGASSPAARFAEGLIFSSFPSSRSSWSPSLPLTLSGSSFLRFTLSSFSLTLSSCSPILPLTLSGSSRFRFTLSSFSLTLSNWSPSLPLTLSGSSRFRFTLSRLSLTLSSRSLTLSPTLSSLSLTLSNWPPSLPLTFRGSSFFSPLIVDPRPGELTGESSSFAKDAAAADLERKKEEPPFLGEPCSEAGEPFICAAALTPSATLLRSPRAPPRRTSLAPSASPASSAVDRSTVSSTSPGAAWSPATAAWNDRISSPSIATIRSPTRSDEVAASPERPVITQQSCPAAPRTAARPMATPKPSGARTSASAITS
eukprot:scaffold127867_cov42-Phaeocystis_antarctica.AAC.2